MKIDLRPWSALTPDEQAAFLLIPPSYAHREDGGAWSFWLPTHEERGDAGFRERLLKGNGSEANWFPVLVKGSYEQLNLEGHSYVEPIGERENH